MNGTGLAIALGVAAVVGGAFGIYPRLDLDISALFFDPNAHAWAADGDAWAGHARHAASWLIALIAAPAVFAVVGKLLLPGVRMLMSGRAALVVLLSLALGPGILANTILKDHWGRYRPSYLAQFGGPDGPFTAWWDPRGDCRGNCSFVAGEPSAAFWTLAPAAFAPPQWRVLAYGAALAFGAAVGLLRIAGGGHFFTDVVFAGVFIFLLIWTLHGLIYRWRLTQLADRSVERALARAGKALRAAFVRLARRLGARADKQL